ncbi:MAG TPA: FAD/NAD(P)-binding protein [Steroidobacteraceae bacterium]|nr:FAD/NAD(P)-binding protein [Steroidobacteraceae bacterium]
MQPLLRTIAIVGAGFSGTALAANLLRHSLPGLTRIVLIERGAEFARGAAYADRGYPYLLNVPAARMSASSEDPLQFLKFAQRRDPSTAGEQFLPRALYGEYLAEVLLAAELAAPRHVRLERLRAEVRAIERPERTAPLQVQLTNGQTLIADDVVLACGNPPPATLPAMRTLDGCERFHADPWSTPHRFSATETILVVGSGLTMVDVVLARAAGMQSLPTVHVISRHGLVPPAQSSFRPDAFKGDGDMLLLAASASMRRLLRVARVLAREAESLGGDWREAVTFVRKMAPTLWQRLPESERRRFLRHVRAYWDIHRHRLPPESVAGLDALRRAGALHMHAGHLRTMKPDGDGIVVTWRPRGQAKNAQQRFGRVINCTGPDYDVERSREPLLRNLVSSGLAIADALGLGFRTGRHGALIDADGWPGIHLYYIGPMLRAQHWEATAAVELRGHAERLAAHLSAQTGGESTASAR